MSPETAAKILSSELQIPEPQIKVETVSEVSGTVVADATLHLAFVLQKDESGQYRIVKVRYSDGRWEAPEKLKNALPSSPLGRALHQAMVDSLDAPKP